MKNIFRLPVSKRKRFTIQSDDSINDQRLSFKAGGILTYLLSKPDDWNLSVPDLVNQSPTEGKSSIRSGLDELRRAGYLTYTQSREKDGRRGPGRWIVYESPELNPNFTLPDSD